MIDTDQRHDAITRVFTPEQEKHYEHPGQRDFTQWNQHGFDGAGDGPEAQHLLVRYDAHGLHPTRIGQTGLGFMQLFLARDVALHALEHLVELVEHAFGQVVARHLLVQGALVAWQLVDHRGNLRKQ